MNADVTHLAALPAPTQSKWALGKVRALILNGAFEPGEKVSELKLCDMLGISRTPIRAALTHLEFEGLLETRDHGGYQVRMFSVTDAEDVLEARAALEGLAVRMAILRGVSDAALTRARELLVCMDTVIGGTKLDAHGVAIYSARNRAFHALLAEMSGSEVIGRHLDHLTASPFGDPSAFVPARALMPDARTAFVVAQEHHKQIVDAISRRECKRAEALLAEHALCGRRAMAHAISTRRTDLVSGGRLIVRPAAQRQAAGH